MPVDYTSYRFPTNFIRKDPSHIQNGSLALAATAHTIAENQHWLALADQPMINFYTRSGFGAADGDNWIGSGGGDTRIVTVRVPPFAQYASFHFRVAKNFNGTSTTVPYIEISSPEESHRLSNIPFGQDETVGAKPIEATAWVEAEWVHFDGIPESNIADIPAALMLVATPDAAWQEVQVYIEVSEDLIVQTGAYKILQNLIALEMDV